MGEVLRFYDATDELVGEIGLKAADPRGSVPLGEVNDLAVFLDSDDEPGQVPTGDEVGELTELLRGVVDLAERERAGALAPRDEFREVLDRARAKLAAKGQGR